MDNRIKIAIYVFLGILALIFVLWLLKTIFSTPAIVFALCVLCGGGIAFLVNFYHDFAFTWQGYLTMGGLGLAALLLFIRWIKLLRRRSGKGPLIRPKEEDPSVRRERHFLQKKSEDRAAISGSVGNPDRPVGCVDDEGNIYKGPEWLKEEPIACIDKQGTVYEGSAWNHGEPIGSIDRDGNIYEEPAWAQREIIGSVDSDGNIYTQSTQHQRHPIGSVDKAGNIRKEPVWKHEYPGSKQIRRAGAAAFILLFHHAAADKKEKG